MTSVPYDRHDARTRGPTDVEHPGTVAGTRHDIGRWGLWGLIATEGALFAYLLASYFYLRQGHVSWPPSGDPELRIALPNTVILLASSGAAWWADRSAKRGSRAGLVLGLAGTMLLGTIFLVLQGVEYSRASTTLQTDAYSSAFFTVTSFHGAHVLVGLLVLGHTLLRALAGHFRAERHEAVTNSTLYWHFVDVVWLFVFTSLYLTPRWW